MSMINIGADAAKLAGLQIDLLQKIRKGHITPSHLEWFLGLTREQRDAFVSSGRTNLKSVGVITIPATTGTFVAEEKFVHDTGHNVSVKISDISNDFETWFLNGDSKTEDSIGEQTLCYAKLRRASVVGPIITELGGVAKAEVTLFEIFFLMERQGSGEDGILLNNGYANIFCVRDKDGLPRVVIVSWFYDGWRVSAYSSVGGLVVLGAGRLVFYRLSAGKAGNPVHEPSEPVPVVY